MATLQVSVNLASKGTISATINVPKIRVSHVSIPQLPFRGLVEELDNRNNQTVDKTTLIKEDAYYSSSIGTNIFTAHSINNNSDPLVISKLHSIMEAIADRVEMHKNIGVQRDNWNHLLLTSVNAITLAAATMTGIAAISTTLEPVVALKVSSTLLYLAATAILVVMNKIQPSQLAEEQRNAARLFKQLHGEIETKLALCKPTINDVNEAMDRVLALDRAYPLPLLGVMLEKFPQIVEPAVWWPKGNQRQIEGLGEKVKGNGWDTKLEEEMREIVEVLQRKDIPEYLRLSEKALNFNRFLAISGPLLTGIAALGSAFVGNTNGVWAEILGVMGGALASVVNTLEHGGQVGMVFEMYRGNAGFFKLMKETIESNIREKDTEKRENGELLKMKVALQLGRSLSELKHIAVLSSENKASKIEEFASKLF
ncbi:F-box protein [Quillaja saponaria]|uniref:F-box protein n=1 Tax=Quillaja saponaria TaxID=32244 RepID=A0AAD7M0J0_QUISA|nr:F-box protein [Quillaja saponaria]